MGGPLSRREMFRIGAAGIAAGALAEDALAAAGTPGVPSGAGRPDGKGADPSAGGVPSSPPVAAPRPFLTPGKDFQDVSRGQPLPHTLRGEAQARARLTPEAWRLEISAEDKAKIERPLTLAAGNALDLPGLMRLGEKHGVRFLKAMQCNNIARPLGQGLWEGVPLRVVLGLCGRSTDARRLYYWGWHNEKPEQMFRSSLAMNQVLDAPPGELPPFLAYRLNGAPISPERGGPVRMVVPWAHGFKSIKWLQRIVLTNRHEANDTYAEKNNDPESYLKTAAYFDDTGTEEFAAGRPVVVRGTCMVGWPGLERVEVWVRPDAGKEGVLPDGDPAWATAEWRPVVIDPPPADWGGGLPEGVLPKDVWGFDAAGRPREWPLRYSIAHWTASLGVMKAGRYEVRVRTVDRNGHAQPEPRPNPRSGRNSIACKRIDVV